VAPRSLRSAGVEPHLAAFTSGQWSELESIVERFENAWRSGTMPVLAEYLPHDVEDRTALLLELAATDLEWRCRSGLAAAAEDYLKRFSQLNDEPRAIVQLAVCEYLARRRAGLSAEVDDFLLRFPAVATELGLELAEAATSDSLATSSRGYARSADSNFESSARPTDVPRRVGRYDLTRAIGGGTFGTVYDAFDTELGRRVAVKVPRHAILPHSDEGMRFVREARSLARLSHPAIVPVLDAGWSDGLFYMVCALIEGPTLADRIRNGPIESRATAQIIATLCDALDHAHHQGIVHRDVKPSNILFDAHGAPWLSDFGLATQPAGDATLTLDGQLLGTPAYMAPEQATGASPQIDCRSDVYSLGAVLYECLTAQLPFVGSPSAILDQIRYCEPLPPNRINPRIDGDLATICLAAMEKHPADRYQTARALGDDLRRYLAGEPIRARPPSPAQRLIKWARRRPALAVLTGVTVGALLTVTSLIWWHNIQLRGSLAQTDEARRQAEASRLESQKSQRITENLLYAADMRLATNSYLSGDRLETLRRLQRYVPSAGTPDRREFAWRRLWSFCHADQLSLVGHTGDVYAAQVIAGGRQLVTAGRDGSLRLWDLDGVPRGRILAQYPTELNFIAVASDGVTMATGCDDGSIILWNLATGRELKRFGGHSNWVLCGAISPDGRQLATAGRDNVIHLWALPGGEPLGELKGHTSTVESLTYFPNGRSLVSTGGDCSLRIWDLSTKSGSVLTTHTEAGCCVACSHDSKSLAMGLQNGDIAIWDIATRSPRGHMSGHIANAWSVAFSPDDARLASAGMDGTVRVWDLATSAQTELFMGHSSRVWSVAWFPDNATLATAGADGTVRLWHCGTSRLERVLTFPTEVGRFWWSADGSRVWAEIRKGAVWLASANGKPMPLATPRNQFQDVTSARRADVIAVARSDDQLGLYNGAGQPLSPLTRLPVNNSYLALSPAGDLLAVGKHDENEKGELSLFALPTFRQRWHRALPRSVVSVELSYQADKLIVVGTDNFVFVSNASDGAIAVTIKTPQLLRVAISPDGRLLATSHLDRSVRIWDSETGTELTCLQGHDGAVQALAFSPDGQTLAAASSANSVTFWHAPSWQEMGRFKTPLAAIKDLAFSSEGNTLAIGGRTEGGAGKVVLWQTRPAGD
jgi:WD40 repeat protein/serine/threonine protein kinase